MEKAASGGAKQRAGTKTAGTRVMTYRVETGLNSSTSFRVGRAFATGVSADRPMRGGACDHRSHATSRCRKSFIRRGRAKRSEYDASSNASLICYTVDTPRDDELEWLALMQHHGAPTRCWILPGHPTLPLSSLLERATEDAAIWAAIFPCCGISTSDNPSTALTLKKRILATPKLCRRYFLPNKHAFVWQGDPFRMPQRVVAQSGTFLVTSHLGMTVEAILARYPGKGELLVKFELPVAKLRAVAMSSLYDMNITQATLFPGLDGLARSMAYEFEYSWEVDLATDERS